MNSVVLRVLLAVLLLSVPAAAGWAVWHADRQVTAFRVRMAVKHPDWFETDADGRLRWRETDD